MKNVAYKNHKKEINELVELLLNGKEQIILYNSHEGYGNTSFIGRCQYILHKTPKLQLFCAELSLQETNPLHLITKNIVSKEGAIYQQMQLFTDEEYGITSIPLAPSIIKDITQSDTLAALFDTKSAPPIYTGFYQDRLKDIFFQIINRIAKYKRVILFIDNVQLIDNESVYELLSLLNNPQITLVLFKTGEGKYFEKLYFETKYNFSEIEISFPEPDIEYVKELSAIYNKKISSSEADLLLYKSQKNVRKLLYYLRMPKTNTNLDDLEQQILKIMYIYNGYICEHELFSICNEGPYSGIYTSELIKTILQKLEEINYISSITNFSDKEKKYIIIKEYVPNIDIADKLTINKSLLQFYYKKNNLDYFHLNQAWEISSVLHENTKLEYFSYQIVKTALEYGFTVKQDVITILKKIKDKKIQLLAAVFLFCNAEYRQSRDILESNPKFINNRNINVMYTIILNRCREHSVAEGKFMQLIKTSQDINELAILVTFLISNCVHSNKIYKAKEIFYKYQPRLQKSKKYPYFLRNAATIFESAQAYELRNSAKIIFKEENDLFGYYSTIINMASYLINNKPKDYATNQVLMAFEGLQQFNASQIHLAANNLGVCFLLNDNHLQATKYLQLAIANAKTIMPITYAMINLSNMYLKMQNFEEAYKCMTPLSNEVEKSTIPRLKTRFYLHLAILEYVNGNFPKSQETCNKAQQYSKSISGTRISAVINLLKNRIKHKIPYNNSLWSEIYIPCFLEYWTINSIDVLSKEFLSF